MKLANAVIKMSKLPDIVQARPVVRHGAKPTIYRLSQLAICRVAAFKI